MFTQLDPRLTAYAVFTAERNARAQKALYTILFAAAGSPLSNEVYVQKTGNRDDYYTVMLSLDSKSTPLTCTCKFFAKNAICKHCYLVAWAQEAAAEEAMIADLYEREEAREFMLETSREHAVGFSAEVYDDVAGAFPA